MSQSRDHKIDDLLVQDLAHIIEQGQKQVATQINSTLTLVYWQVGHRINTHILENQRAAYAQEIIPTLSVQLKAKYGRSFSERNLRRMMQFAQIFSEFEKLTPLVTQLSWTHFITLLPIKDKAERYFYAQKAVEEHWSKRQLQHQIERKVYQRNEIAQVQIEDHAEALGATFKDPYFLDFLGLKEEYLEDDLEGAILRCLQRANGTVSEMAGQI